MLTTQRIPLWYSIWYLLGMLGQAGEPFPGRVDTSQRLGPAENRERLKQRQANSSPGHRDADRSLRLAERQPIRGADRLERFAQRVGLPSHRRITCRDVGEQVSGWLLHRLRPRGLVDGRLRQESEVHHRRDLRKQR